MNFACIPSVRWSGGWQDWWGAAGEGGSVSAVGVVKLIVAAQCTVVLKRLSKGVLTS